MALPWPGFELKISQSQDEHFSVSNLYLAFLLPGFNLTWQTVSSEPERAQYGVSSGSAGGPLLFMPKIQRCNSEASTLIQFSEMKTALNWMEGHIVKRSFGISTACSL